METESKKVELINILFIKEGESWKDGWSNANRAS